MRERIECAPPLRSGVRIQILINNNNPSIRTIRYPTGYEAKKCNEMIQ